MDEVQEILRRHPELAFAADKDGMTPLRWAADRGSLDAVEALLALVGTGAVASSRLGFQDHAGDTALHYAVLTDNAEIARRLVSHGADPHVANNEGETAYATAQEQGWDVSDIF